MLEFYIILKKPRKKKDFYQKKKFFYHPANNFERVFGTRNKNYLYLYVKICSSWKELPLTKFLIFFKYSFNIRKIN